MGSSSAIGREGSHFRKTESFSCYISNADQFDQNKFVNVLKQEVESDLKDAKAKITSSQDHDATFNIDYEIGETEGSVKIEGRLDPAHNFTVTAELSEDRAKSK